MKPIWISAAIACLLVTGCDKDDPAQSESALTASPAPSEQKPAPAVPGRLKAEVNPGLPPVIQENTVSFRFVADTDLDRSSVMKAIEEQTASSHPDRTSLTYRVDWVNDREFRLVFSGLLPGEVIHSSALHSKDSAGGSLNEAEMTDLYSVVFQHREPGRQPGLIATRPTDRTRRSFELASDKPAVFIQQDRSGDKYVLSVEDDSYRLVNLQTEDAVRIEKKRSKTESKYASLYGYKETQPSNRIHEGFLYVVKDHTSVYKVSLKSSKWEHLYSSELPILGVSSSPDGGSHIGITVSSHPDLRAEADLIVLDRTGKVKATFPKIAFLSHSDGLLSRYSLDWVDPATVKVYSEFPDDPGTNSGYYEVDIRNRTVRKTPDPIYGNEAYRRLLKTEPEAQPYLSPDESKLAYTTRSNAGFYLEIWVLDLTDNTTSLVGVGRLLGWVTDDELAWLEYPATTKTPFPAFAGGG